MAKEKYYIFYEHRGRMKVLGFYTIKGVDKWIKEKWNDKIDDGYLIEGKILKGL